MLFRSQTRHTPPQHAPPCVQFLFNRPHCAGAEAVKNIVLAGVGRVVVTLDRLFFDCGEQRRISTIPQTETDVSVPNAAAIAARG
jgi:hypothetical protein